MIDNSSAIKVPRVAAGKDIVSANVKVNTLFCSYIFNTRHGLPPLKGDEFDPAALLDDDIAGTIEERQYRLWINSLGIDGVDVNDLYVDVKNGILLNKILDHLRPGSVNWKYIEMTKDHIIAH